MDCAAGSGPTDCASPLRVTSRTCRVNRDCGWARQTMFALNTIATIVSKTTVSFRITVFSLKNRLEFQSGCLNVVLPPHPGRLISLRDSESHQIAFNVYPIALIQVSGRVASTVVSRLAVQDDKPESSLRQKLS